MAALDQRQRKKGRRNERASGGARVSKSPVADNLSSLLPQAVDGVYNNPPLAHTLVSLIGCVVEVQLVSGDVYEGILRAISPNMEISLNVAHVKGQPPTIASVYNRKEVKFADVVTISAKTGTNPQLDIFKTDTEIGGRPNGSQSRQLQPFTDFTDEDSIVGSSEDTGGWSVEEMWTVNQDKFKVSSTYDAELPQYTTPLLREGESYKQREMEAIQLANEIESKTMFSRHGIDDKGTEEDRWSSVVRETERPLPVVKENGDHMTTITHDITPCTQTPPTPTTPPIAPPTATPPLLIAPPASTLSPLPVTTEPNSSDNDTISDTPPPAPPPPAQLPGNNQTSSSDDVVVNDIIIDKSNEELTPAISDVSLGEPTSVDDDGAATAGELMAVDQPSPSSNDDDRETKQEATPPSQPVSGEEKEKNIKNFKLDPTAKEFVAAFVPPSLTPSTTAVSGAASGFPTTAAHTHTRTHAHTPRGGGGGNSRYSGNHSQQRVRGPTPTSIFSHLSSPGGDSIMQTAVSSSYMLSQQPGGGVAGLIRPNIMQHTGFSQYANPLGVAVPQLVTANPHTSMIATAAGTGQQPFPLGSVLQQPQLFPQPTQTIITPQGVMMPATYMGGVPLSPLQQQQHSQMVAAAGLQQVNPALMGATAASSLSRALYQLPGTGKQ